MDWQKDSRDNENEHIIRPLHNTIICTDASNQKGAVVYTHASDDELHDLLATSRHVGGHLEPPGLLGDFEEVHS